jgi:hypothetical protein
VILLVKIESRTSKNPYNTKAVNGTITGILLRDTHQLKKQKNETTRSLAVKKKKHLPLNAPRLIYQAGTGRRQDQITV